MHVIRQPVLSCHPVGEARRATCLRATAAGNSRIQMDSSISKPLSMLDTASLQSIDVSKVAGIPVDDPAMPRPRTMA
jgi:hypothetical protein